MLTAYHVQIVADQIGTGRSFLSGPLSTAAGESPSEPGRLEKMPTAGPRKPMKAGQALNLIPCEQLHVGRQSWASD